MPNGAIMPVDPPPPIGSRTEDARDRVKYLLAHLWRGNQREMARAVGVSQGLISKVVNGQQAPGPRLLTALANHPGVDSDWVVSGTGQPIPFPERGSLPIAAGVLPGPPLEYPHLLGGSRHPVADALSRPTRYWLLLAQNSPLVREPSLRLAPGDLLLLDSDPAWTRRPDLTDGRLCGVRLPAHPSPEYHLGRVVLLPRGLVVQLFGGSFVWPRPASPTAGRVPDRDTPRPRRKVRMLEGEKEKKRKREQVEEQARTDARDGLPIDQGDIVAVLVYMVRPDPMTL
jgi:hypothetical protein